MDVNGIWSGLFAAIVVGALGRVLVRGYQPIGCLLTLLIGLVGAPIGGAIGHSQHWGFWRTFALQILISALLVLPFSLGRATASGDRGRPATPARSRLRRIVPQGRGRRPRGRVRAPRRHTWLRANMVASVTAPSTGPDGRSAGVSSPPTASCSRRCAGRPTSCWSAPGRRASRGTGPRGCRSPWSAPG